MSSGSTASWNRRLRDSGPPAVALAATAACVWLHWEFFRHAGPLWRDETATAALSQRLAWSALWSGTDKDFFPALYFFLLRLWMAVAGEADSALRVPGLLIGLASVAGLWLHAKALGARTPVLSLALLGLSPLAVRSLDYVRPYGLGVLCLLAISASVWRLVERPGARAAAWAAAAAILGLRCLYQNAFFILAFCLAGAAISWTRKDRRAAALILGVGLAAAVSLLPELSGVAGARKEQLICRSANNFESVWGAFREAFGRPRIWFILLWWLGPLLGLARSFQDRRAAFLGLSFIIAAPLTFLSMKASGMHVQAHYFLPLMALLAVSLDVFWDRAWASLAAGALLLSFPGARAQLQARQTNLDRLASVIEREARPGDLILVNPWHYGLAFQRYYRGTIPWVTLPPLETGDDFKIQNYRPVQAVMDKPDLLAPVLSRMAGALKAGHRLWLVGGLEYSPVPPKRPEGVFIGPYYWYWSAQAGHFARLHARRVVQGRGSPPGSVNRLEDVRLEMAEGWKE